MQYIEYGYILITETTQGLHDRHRDSQGVAKKLDSLVAAESELNDINTHPRESVSKN